MRYVYHLGVHATSTGLYQRILNENIEHLRAQGVFYVNVEWPKALLRHRKTARRICDPNIETPPADTLYDTNKTIYDAARNADASIILMSDENRLGVPLYQDLSWGTQTPEFYPHAVTCARCLTAGLPLRRSRFIWQSQDPETHLLDLYSESIRQGVVNMDVDRFCRSVDFGSIDFEGMQHRVQSLHSKLDLRVRPLENFTQDRSAAAYQFLEDIGLDPAPFSINLPPERPRLDAIQVEALLHISRQATDQKWRFIRAQRDKVLSYAPDPNHPLELPDWVQNTLRSDAQDTESTAA